MLATVPPGSMVDIAPSWLVEQVTATLRADHQRSERVAAARKRRPGNGEGKDKGKSDVGKGLPYADDS